MHAESPRARDPRLMKAINDSLISIAVTIAVHIEPRQTIKQLISGIVFSRLPSIVSGTVSMAPCQVVV